MASTERCVEAIFRVEAPNMNELRLLYGLVSINGPLE